MSTKQTIIGEALPNMPWQNKPTRHSEVLWRYRDNPVIDINPIPCAQSIYNSAVIPFEGVFVGVFRVDYKSILHAIPTFW